MWLGLPDTPICSKIIHLPGSKGNIIEQTVNPTQSVINVIKTGTNVLTTSFIPNEPDARDVLI